MVKIKRHHTKNTHTHTQTHTHRNSFEVRTLKWYSEFTSMWCIFLSMSFLLWPTSHESRSIRCWLKILANRKTPSTTNVSAKRAEMRKTTSAINTVIHHTIKNQHTRSRILRQTVLDSNLWTNHRVWNDKQWRKLSFIKSTQEDKWTCFWTSIRSASHETTKVIISNRAKGFNSSFKCTLSPRQSHVSRQVDS